MNIHKMLNIMPDDIIDITIIDDKLRGFTKAKLIEIEGVKHVMKKGVSDGQIREEYTANLIYRILGVNIPNMALYKTNNRYILLSKYIENKKGLDLINNENLARQEKIFEKISHYFVADAFLANWDIFKLDNIIYDKNDNIYRVDSGGALRYRARGEMKGTAFKNDVAELQTMLETAPIGISKYLNKDKMNKQITAILHKKNEVLNLVKDDKDLYYKLQKRFESLMR